MNDILLFGGTTEGREIAEAFSDCAITIHVSVATDYGETLVSPASNIRIISGRKDTDGIENLIREIKPALIIDATHPYATEVTNAVKQAAGRTNTELIRVLRKADGKGTDGCICVSDTDEAVMYLNGTSGNILLTTGSKELLHYTAVNAFEERIYARILPLRDAVENANALGFSGNHLICMQGPFSEDMNIALLRMTNAKYLVTKDTGEQGGFSEKISAAKKCGAVPVIIRRPTEESGISTDECIRLIETRFSVKAVQKKQVAIVGIGTGDLSCMTQAVKDACEKAELIIGAKRVTDALSVFGKPTENAVSSSEIDGIVRNSPYSRIVIAMSGDTGFFSGTKQLLARISDLDPVVLPGISSVSYLASRIGVSWDDACIISLHGRGNNAAVKIRKNEKTFILVGGENGAGKLLQRLSKYGLGDISVSVGENLSYDDEKISSGTVDELKDKTYSPLAVVYAENRNAKENVVTGGIPDECFIRSDVPMSKQEIRAVSLSKMQLTKDAICWDVGSGTGSVSVEMALFAEDGFVYAVEKNAEACALSRQNAERFCCDNIEALQGTAPDALKNLPAPTHVFIGGSGGNIRGIIKTALSANPVVRIVINTVTMESLCETTLAIKELNIKNAEYTEINAARSRRLGSYNLMTAQNPVYVISFGGKRNE